MDIRTKRALTQSLSDKVRRRICPRCRQGLQHSVIEVNLSDSAAQVGFTCTGCGFQSGGMVVLSDRIKRELETGKVPEPISVDEVDLVRNVLANWRGSLAELIA